MCFFLVEILEAMLRGQYILTSKWLDMCLEENDFVKEDMYEITTINRNGQLVAKNSCSIARENYARMVSLSFALLLWQHFWLKAKANIIE